MVKIMEEYAFPFRDDVFLSCDQGLEFYITILGLSLENEQADAGPDGRRETKLSGASGDRQGNVYFLCTADHEQDWQPHPRLIHTLLFSQYM